MRLGVVMGGDSADAPFIRVHAAFALNASPDGEAELVTSVVADVVAGHQRIRRQSNYSFWIRSKGGIASTVKYSFTRLRIKYISHIDYTPVPFCFRGGTPKA